MQRMPCRLLRWICRLQRLRPLLCWLVLDWHRGLNRGDMPLLLDRHIRQRARHRNMRAVRRRFIRRRCWCKCVRLVPCGCILYPHGHDGLQRVRCLRGGILLDDKRSHSVLFVSARYPNVKFWSNSGGKLHRLPGRPVFHRRRECMRRLPGGLLRSSPSCFGMPPVCRRLCRRLAGDDDLHQLHCRIGCASRWEDCLRGMCTWVLLAGTRRHCVRAVPFWILWQRRRSQCLHRLPRRRVLDG